MDTSVIDIKISVIIPTYNMAQYIGECLDCVFQQTLSEIEVICVDDGSTDGTAQILRAYAAKKSNMHFFLQNHCYAGAARNLGIRHAHGEFVAFLDADDLYECDDALATLYNEAKANKVLCCGGNLQNYWMDGSKVERETGCPWFDKNKKMTFDEYQIPHSYTAFIYDRKTLIENALFFPQCKVYEDPPFFARYLMHINVFFVLKKIVYHRRLIPKKYSLPDIEDFLFGMADVLEMAAKMRSRYDNLYVFMLHCIVKYIKFLYLGIVQREDKKAAYLRILYRIRQTMRIPTDFQILRWDNDCCIDESWVLKQYNHALLEKNNRLALIYKAKKIAIYGAGKLGMEYADYLVNKLGKSVQYFVVSKRNYQPRIVKGINVQDIYSLPQKEDYLIIVAMNEKWHKEVRLILSHFRVGATIYLGSDLIYDIMQ